MYALIDTFNGHYYPDGRVLGGIISCHRSVDAAERADARHQRRVRRANGAGSYVPTTIVAVEWTDGKRARGPVARANKGLRAKIRRVANQAGSAASAAHAIRGLARTVALTSRGRATLELVARDYDPNGFEYDPSDSEHPLGSYEA